MIIPFFDGISSFLKAPITLVLLLINVLIFSFLFSNHSMSVNHFFKDKYFVDSQISMYKSYILNHTHLYEQDKVLYAKRIYELPPKHKVQFSALAFMDESFRVFLKTKPSIYDSVALEYSLQKYQEIESSITSSFEFYLGLQTYDWHSVSLFSYQFMHGGWFHLFGNMLFLLILGSFLEVRKGGFTVFLLYLLSGLGAGLLFLKFNTNSLTPLVGASGSISGLLSYICVVYWNKPIKYLWFVGFNKWSYGLVWLPAWITLFFWVLQDLAGLLANPSILGGVSFTAHIGGHLVGASLGLMYLAYQKLKLSLPNFTAPITNLH